MGSSFRHNASSETTYDNPEQIQQLKRAAESQNKYNDSKHAANTEAMQEQTKTQTPKTSTTENSTYLVITTK